MGNVVFKGVGKIYEGDVRAVVDFDLEVPDGSFCVFVGPSGCGKSTSLRMVAGLESVTSGEICIDGRCVNHLPPKDRDIAMVFQNYALYPHMTVRKNMGFGLKIRGYRRAEVDARVREASAILGLDDLLDRKPSALSGGQKQRVAMGRAIVRKPRVFLFDEPLSNLDAKLRVAMRSEISRLHKQLKITTIYVTHDQVEAMTMGDRIVVMNAGRIQQVADPLTLYNRPVNKFVASFIGTPTMNFFDMALSREGGRCVLRRGGLSLGVPDRLAQRLKGLADGDARMILGVRPEDICSRTEMGASPDAARLTAEVEAVEPLGSMTYLHMRNELGPFVARGPKTATHRDIGQRLELGLDIETACFFDARTEASLLT